MSVEQVLAVAERLGADLSLVVVGRAVDRVPEAPSHRWIVIPTDTGGCLLGGMDRGAFAAYGRYEDVDNAARALATLTRPADAPPLPRDRADLDAAAREVAARLEAAGLSDGPLPGSAIPVGAPLDHIGNESGHFLSLIDTPMSARSLPPTDLAEPRTGYLVTAPLPDRVQVSRTPPWFGQPGGGVLVELDRVIAAYCDAEVLRRFSLAEEPVG